MQRIRLKYSKEDGLRFIGHLDMVRLWERAIRRTDIPIAYTEGFNIRQKLSFGPPLSLGIISECEFLDIYLEKWINPDSVAEILNRTLPQGIKIYKAEEVLLHLPSLTAAITVAVYSAELNIENGKNIHFSQRGLSDPALLELDSKQKVLGSSAARKGNDFCRSSLKFNSIKIKIDEIMNKKEIIVKRKDKTINVRPYIINIEQKNERKLEITVKCDNFGTLKAQEIIDLFDGFELKNLKRILLK